MRVFSQKIRPGLVHAAGTSPAPGEAGAGHLASTCRIAREMGAGWLLAGVRLCFFLRRFDGQGRRLGPPVVPFYPFLGEGSPTKLDYRRKKKTVGTLIPPTSLLEDLNEPP